MEMYILLKFPSEIRVHVDSGVTACTCMFSSFLPKKKKVYILIREANFKIIQSSIASEFMVESKE